MANADAQKAGRIRIQDVLFNPQPWLRPRLRCGLLLTVRLSSPSALRLHPPLYFSAILLLYMLIMRKLGVRLLGLALPLLPPRLLQ
jgi:hypothetical protein